MVVGSNRTDGVNRPPTIGADFSELDSQMFSFLQLKVDSKHKNRLITRYVRKKTYFSLLNSIPALRRNKVESPSR